MTLSTVTPEAPALAPIRLARPLTRRTAIWYYCAMLGEPENQFFLRRASAHRVRAKGNL
jgi:hypothetical protein